MSSAFDVQAIDGSPLALETRGIAPGAAIELADAASDTLLYVAAGSGTLSSDHAERAVRARSAALVVAGETARVAAETELGLVVGREEVGKEEEGPVASRIDRAPERAIDAFVNGWILVGVRTTAGEKTLTACASHVVLDRLHQAVHGHRRGGALARHAAATSSSP